MGTYESVLQIKSSGNLTGTKTIVTMKFRDFIKNACVQVHMLKKNLLYFLYTSNFLAYWLTVTIDLRLEKNEEI